MNKLCNAHITKLIVKATMGMISLNNALMIQENCSSAAAQLHEKDGTWS